MENLYKNDTKRPWDLDKAVIFDHIFSFSRRLKDLIEVCETQKHLRLKWEEHVIDRFLVFGSNYEQLEQDYVDCIQTFEVSLVDIQSVSFRVETANLVYFTRSLILLWNVEEFNYIHFWIKNTRSLKKHLIGECSFAVSTLNS